MSPTSSRFPLSLRHAFDWSRVIILPVLALGLVLLGMAGWQVAQHLQSLSWRPVTAELLDLRGERAYFGDGMVPLNAGSRVAGRYAYAWEGRVYFGTRLSFSVAYSRRNATADAWVDRLSDHLGSVGGQLTVWVDPRRPERAVAFRDVRWLEVGAEVGFGLLLSLVGWGVLRRGRASAAPGGFSWTAVAVTWVVGSLLGVLAPLLWRDGHPIWALVTALPLLVAVNGTLYGLRRRHRSGSSPAGLSADRASRL